MLWANPDPGLVPNLQIGRGRDLEPVADLDPGDSIGLSDDMARREIRHADGARDLGRIRSLENLVSQSVLNEFTRHENRNAIGQQERASKVVCHHGDGNIRLGDRLL